MTDVEKQSEKEKESDGRMGVKSVLLVIMVASFLGLCAVLIILDRDILVPQTQSIVVEDYPEIIPPQVLESYQLLREVYQPEEHAIIVEYDEDDPEERWETLAPTTPMIETTYESDVIDDDDSEELGRELAPTSSMAPIKVGEIGDHLVSKTIDVAPEVRILPMGYNTKQLVDFIIPKSIPREPMLNVLSPYSVFLDIVVVDYPEDKLEPSSVVSPALEHQETPVSSPTLAGSEDKVSADVTDPKGPSPVLEENQEIVGNSSALNSALLQMTLPKDFRNEFQLLNKIMSVINQMSH